MLQPTLEELIADPHPANHRLREAGSVVWVDALDGWVVTTRDRAAEVMRDAVTYTVDDPRFTTAQVVGPSMLSLDGAEHRRHRGPFADAYRDPALRLRLSEFIADRSVALVEAIAAIGHADLRMALAAPLAVEVMTESLGLDATPAEVLAMYRSIVGSVEALTAGAEGAAAGAQGAMAALGGAVATAREADADLLRRPAESLTNDELVSNVAVVMFGGVETTEAMIGNALWFLLSQPEIVDEVLADRTLVSGVVEESLRLEPAATRVDRYATADVRVDGADIKRGELVIVNLAAANRDPAVFEEPDRFNPARPEARLNVTFAQGPHTCLASHVARAEAVAAVDAVLDRLRGVRLAEDAVPPTGLVFRKPDRVPVEWDLA